MPKIKITYEEYDDHLLPMKMIIFFGRDNFQWDKQRFSLPLNAPFERQQADDFQDDILSLSITQGELTVHPDHPDRFAISIPLLVTRLEKMKIDCQIPHDFDYSTIEQFIIQMDDIEEIMQMEVRPFYEWR